MQDWISTTLVAIIVHKIDKVRAKAAETEAIVTATTAMVKAAVTVTGAAKAAVTMTTAEQSARTTIVAAAISATVLGIRRRIFAVDGATIKLGGCTSWAALQPHRKACYGRAIALWL